MIKTNYHTHCNYCDGNSPLRDYVLEAIRHGFKAIGFTSHSPISDDNGFSIKHADVSKYSDEVNALKREFADQIEILLSFEFEYIPGVTRPMQEVAKQWNFDYILGSVHLVAGREPVVSANDLWFTDGPDVAQYDKGLFKFFDGDIRKAVKAFYHQVNLMLENEHLDMIGHFDKVKMNNKGRYFREDEAWYLDFVNETIDLIKQKDVIVEVNTRGLYKQRHNDYFPSVDILKRLKNLNIPITISSDAHAPGDLNLLWEDSYKHLLELGFKPAGKFRKLEVLQ
ncbi:MAG: histidinol-phosphatase [Bacteroidales bacterium]|jgi:histidinol-phosphatase (PHP family)|nr:histidinol-phosphatase [Bacteroidales bacterium]